MKPRRSSKLLVFATLLLPLCGLLTLTGCFEKEVIREPDHHHDLYHQSLVEQNQLSVDWQH